MDGYTVNPGDLSWQPLEDLGELTVYERTEAGNIVTRSQQCEVVVVNKIAIGPAEMEQLPDLKLICLLATGFDNVNVAAAKELGIAVCNAVGYGIESVAQHTLALILALTNRVELHHQSVQSGDWSRQPDFSYTLLTVHELAGKVLGLIGVGQIGSRVAELAQAFGMRVIAPQRQSLTDPTIDGVALDELFRASDIISLHVPLNQETKHIINARSLDLMKDTALLVNTGRGALVDEKSLAWALLNNKIAGAALDVLSLEPPTDKNPLIHQKNTLITPHMAWCSKQARQALISIVASNIRSYSEGSAENRVV